MKILFEMSVSPAVHSLFFYMAAVGCTFLVLQFILSVVGFGDSDSDLDAGSDLGAGADVGADVGTDADMSADTDSSTNIHGADSVSGGRLTLFFQYISFRSLVTFSAFFGLFGLLAESWRFSAFFAVLTGVAAGIFFAVSVTRTMKMLKKINTNGCTRFDSVAGLTATVYIPVPENRSGAGKIQIVVNGRTEEMEAWTDGGELATGTQVTVIDRLGADSVLVKLF